MRTHTSTRRREAADQPHARLRVLDYRATAARDRRPGRIEVHDGADRSHPIAEVELTTRPPAHWVWTSAAGPEMILEDEPHALGHSYLVTRPDGTPFGRIARRGIVRRRLDLLAPDGLLACVLRERSGDRHCLVTEPGGRVLGLLQRTTAGPAAGLAARQDYRLTLERGLDPTLQALALAAPLCLDHARREPPLAPLAHRHARRPAV